MILTVILNFLFKTWAKSFAENDQKVKNAKNLENIFLIYSECFKMHLKPKCPEQCFWHSRIKYGIYQYLAENDLILAKSSIEEQAPIE